jgi:hypothetical protein
VAESLKCERSDVWITAIERADPHGEGDVVALLPWIEFEFLGRELTSSQPLGRDEVGGRLSVPASRR